MKWICYYHTKAGLSCSVKKLLHEEKISFAGKEKFWERGNLGHRGGNGRPRISNQRVEQVQLLFQNDLVLVSTELQLLYKCFQRQYIEFCVCVSTSPRKKCKNCISCTRFTSRIDFSLLNNVEIIWTATQNSFVEFYLPMNAYFASMGMLTSEMPGFWEQSVLLKEIKYP